MSPKNKTILKIIVSAALLIFATKMIYQKLTVYFYKDTYTITLTKSEIKKDNEIKLSNENKNTISSQTLSLANESPKENEGSTLKNLEKDNEKKKEGKNYKITLRYTNKKAKKVKISGSFFSWKERDMKKEGDQYLIELLLKEPGEYKYYFIVDGKKVLDPNATKTKDGKYSILEVK
jgi:hypothetical protein